MNESGGRRFRPRAWQDITETAEHLETQAGIELAERFIDAVIETTQCLLKMPLISSPCRFQRPELRDFRALQVNDFERWLMFYRPVEGGIEVARVLHGARDWKSIFD
jgi:toxin ParE1/3/4